MNFKYKLMSLYSLTVSLGYWLLEHTAETLLWWLVHTSTLYQSDPSEQPGDNGSCCSLLIWAVANTFTTEKLSKKQFITDWHSVFLEDVCFIDHGGFKNQTKNWKLNCMRKEFSSTVQAPYSLFRNKAVWKSSMNMFKPNWGSRETHASFVLTWGGWWNVL